MAHKTDLPPKGKSFIAYKKLRTPDGGTALATLLVPKDADRVKPNFGNGKIRVSKAKVVSIVSIDTRGRRSSGLNFHTQFTPTKYEVGKVVKADRLNKNLNSACGAGINIFLNRSQARNYH